MRSIVTTIERDWPCSTRRVPKRAGGAERAEKRHDRQQESENDIGDFLKAQEPSAGYRADPSGLFFSLGAIHRSPCSRHFSTRL